MKILFKYTTRSRPEHFERGLESILDNVVSDDFLILVSTDMDDTTMDKMIEKWGEHEKVVFSIGVSKNKIDAINRDLDVIKDWDILVNMSDDMVFIEKGFDNIIRRDFSVEKFKVGFNQLDQYFHYNDGNQKANVCTMHIVGRDYFDRFKYIYHPDYISLWCDCENDMVANKLGCYKYMGDNVQIFKHLHPAFGLAYNDDQYKKNEAREMWIADERTFNRRKQINFGL